MIPKEDNNRQQFQAKFSIVATLLILICFAVAMYHYQNARYSYSIFNHFISELGHTEGSDYYISFSIGLCIASLSLIVYLTMMENILNDRFSKYGKYIGILACISCFMVGLFPADTHLKPHLLFALIFFFGNMISCLFYGISIFKSNTQKLHIWTGILPIITAVCSFIFLILPKEEVRIFLKDRHNYDRPDFWIHPIFEWSVLIGLLTWILISSLSVIRRERE